MIPLPIFIGYDPKEAVAFHVLSHSILSRATIPVSIIPLRRESLRFIYQRPRDALDSTEFSRTRFLAPFLTRYSGWSVFMDCDMLCLADIAELMQVVMRRPTAAVYCCMHDYTPSTSTKFLGQEQTKYARKNWSSMMVFQGEECRSLHPSAVQEKSGLWLHRMEWAGTDIAPLPIEWNWLVGEYPTPKVTPKIIHYTLGGPWFDEYSECEYANEWFSERSAMLHATQRSAR